jgi:hypothetical protein
MLSHRGGRGGKEDIEYFDISAKLTPTNCFRYISTVKNNQILSTVILVCAHPEIPDGH